MNILYTVKMQILNNSICAKIKPRAKVWFYSKFLFKLRFYLIDLFNTSLTDEVFVLSMHKEVLNFWINSHFIDVPFVVFIMRIVLGLFENTFHSLTEDHYLVFTYTTT